MSEWLKIQLAETMGIAANMHFPLPSSFIWDLYKKLLPDVPDTSPYNKDRLRWHVYETLPNLLDRAEFKDIKGYLELKSLHTDTNTRRQFEQLRRMQLSEKISDAYDNYLMYRQEWLTHWEQGHNDLPAHFDDDIKNQSWQAILWRDLTVRITNQTANAHHRASLHHALVKTLTETDTNKLKDKLPERLTVFGISTLPKHQLEILQLLSRHIPVDFYWNNPCRHYWGDIQSKKTLARQKQNDQYFVIGNPLLASWGKIGRDFLDLITTCELPQVDLFLDLQDVTESYAENVVDHDAQSSLDSKQMTCLQAIQSDILNLRFRDSAEPLTVQQLNSDTGKRTLGSNESSIRIHSCHSRLRELEVLKDQLLEWFERDPNLTTRDIIVMVPDINDYAPFIDSVFARKPGAPEQYIPYSIADRSGMAEQPLLTLVTELIKLPFSRFKATELIGWLENDLVMQAFDLEPAELNTLKRWVQAAEIKWAANAEHKSRWQSQALPISTWQYGLKRLLFGFANGKESVWQGIASLPLVEGLDANVLAKLINFVSYLTELSNKFNQPATIDAWQSKLNAMIDGLFSDHENQQSVSDKLVLQRIRDAISKMLEYQTLGDVNHEINGLLIHHFLTNELSDTGVSQRFYAGRVNFCTLMPMRSVPFNIVCVLGLNDREFPRTVNPLSFDLVNLNSARKGDRSRKLDERYLFLEAICSVREKLHLSYVGQSQRDNKPSPPSILLSELMDYIDDSHIVDNHESDSNKADVISPSKMLTTNHALQPFNEIYFVDNLVGGVVKSYDYQWGRSCEAPVVSVANGGREQEGMPSEVSFEELIRFAKHPIKSFYKNALNARLDVDNELLDDVEQFEHDNLQRYQFVNDMFYSEKISDSKKLNWTTSGAFPPGQWGKTLLDSYQKDVETIVGKQNSVDNFIKQTNLPIANLNKAVSFEFSQDDLRINERDPLAHDNLNQLLRLNNVRNSVILNGQVSLKNSLFFISALGSSANERHMIEAWLLHLLQAASGKLGMTCMLSKKDKQFMSFAPVSETSAKTQLALWCACYASVNVGMTPFVWHIEPAWQWLKTKRASGEEKATEYLNKYRADISTDGTKDAYVARYFNEQVEFPFNFETMTELLLGPLHEHIQTVSVSKQKEMAEFFDLYERALDKGQGA
jgi:exodeoxyribonuclease V gamma subunit